MNSVESLIYLNLEICGNDEMDVDDIQNNGPEGIGKVSFE